MDYSGKVALITGGARGIGFAIAEALLMKGCKACLADVIVKEGEESAKRLVTKYGQDTAMFVKCDVTDEEEFKATIQHVINKMGRLDILANNAGINDESHWKRTVEINLIGVISGVKLGLEYMGKKQGRDNGFIINTSSLLGFTPSAQIPVYSATKHAILGLTRSYGMPFHFDKTGVSVKAICPTAVNTEMLKTLSCPRMLKGIEEKHPPVEPSYIAEGFMKLLEEGQNGAVMYISHTGFHYI